MTEFNRPRPVPAYQAKDGKLFINEDMAMEHNRQIEFLKWFRRDFGNDLPNIQGEDMFCWIDKHYLQLKNIFDKR